MLFFLTNIQENENMPISIQPNLFIQFIEQGIKKGLLEDVTRTLDGEYYLDKQYLKDTISKQVETHGEFFCVPKKKNALIYIFIL